MIRLEDIHFHDCVLLRVVEAPETDELIMDVEYPVDWDNELYEPRSIVFTEVLNYEVHEGPFQGAPTILDYSLISSDSAGSRIRLETNAGYRLLTFREVGIRECTGKRST